MWFQNRRAKSAKQHQAPSGSSSREEPSPGQPSNQSEYIAGARLSLKSRAHSSIWAILFLPKIHRVTKWILTSSVHRDARGGHVGAVHSKEVFGHPGPASTCRCNLLSFVNMGLASALTQQSMDAHSQWCGGSRAGMVVMMICKHLWGRGTNVKTGLKALSSSDGLSPIESLPKETRRKRTSIKRSHTSILVEAFQQNRYPGIKTREELAKQTGLPEGRIQVSSRPLAAHLSQLRVLSCRLDVAG